MRLPEHYKISPCDCLDAVDCLLRYPTCDGCPAHLKPAQCAATCPRCAVDKVIEDVKMKRKFIHGEIDRLQAGGFYAPKTIEKLKVKAKCCTELLKEWGAD